MNLQWRYLAKKTNRIWRILRGVKEFQNGTVPHFKWRDPSGQVNTLTISQGKTRGSASWPETHIEKNSSSHPKPLETEFAMCCERQTVVLPLQQNVIQKDRWLGSAFWRLFFGKWLFQIQRPPIVDFGESLTLTTLKNIWLQECFGRNFEKLFFWKKQNDNGFHWGYPRPTNSWKVKVFRGPFIKMNRLVCHCWWLGDTPKVFNLFIIFFPKNQITIPWLPPVYTTKQRMMSPCALGKELYEF